MSGFCARSPRAPIAFVTVAWWPKEGEAFRDALRERERSKLGRSARLRGVSEVATVTNRVSQDDTDGLTL